MKILYKGIETEEFTYGGEYEVQSVIRRGKESIYKCFDQNGNISPVSSYACEIVYPYVRTISDGLLKLVPFSYVIGDDWQYMYSDEWKGTEFNVYQCMNGEIVAVNCAEI